MDESFDPGQSGMFAVGGVMGRGWPLFGLETDWEKLRKRPDINIPYYKATECEHGKGEFSKFVSNPGYPSKFEREKLRAISLEFISLIPRQDNLLVYAVGVVLEDFFEVIPQKPNLKRETQHEKTQAAGRD